MSRIGAKVSHDVILLIQTFQSRYPVLDWTTYVPLLFLPRRVTVLTYSQTSHSTITTLMILIGSASYGMWSGTAQADYD
jgi:aromatic ring-opening dioxygenase LigB subunit